MLTNRTTTDLAHQLAQFARRLNEIITIIVDDDIRHGTLHQQLVAFRDTLLPTMTNEEFADMYAQTLVYGLFAARVSKSDSPTFTRFDAAHTIPTTTPFLRKMFQQIAAFDLDERMAWLVDDCARLLQQTNMSDVLRDFGKATKQEDPVVHFYETFLAAYDPKTREMRGVYYTPEPVVSYIVRSVDHLLQTCFDKPDGLANDETLILDPATGTATFLHAVVQHIYTTLQEMGMADAWAAYVPKKLLPRVFGFELLMAPYTVAHLKLSMLLQQLGYDFGSTERLGIYLTNALDELPAGQAPFPFTSFIVDEGIQAREVKQNKPVMVVLGNPPYSNFGMLNKGEWIRKQLEEYKHGLQEKKLNLDDDFIKFIRFGQWRIEQTGQGIVAFITNNTYIDGITHRRMRESLMETFTDIYILDLHGSNLKKEVCPNGSLDENVFDIRQGVAIGIFVKEPNKTGCARVHHAEMWGMRAQKYATLESTDITTTAWKQLHPKADYFFFVQKDFGIEAEYAAYCRFENIPILVQGAIKTDRDGLVFDLDRAVLHERMQTFYSKEGLSPDFCTKYRVENSSSYEILTRRERTTFDATHIQRCLYRPFDIRWLYYEPSGLTSRPAYDVMQHMVAGNNIALLICRQQAITGFYHTLCADTIVESHAVSLKTREGAFVFPLYLYPTEQEVESGLYKANDRRPNPSAAFITDIEQRLGLSFIPDGTGDMSTTIGPEDIFHYIYAIFHSPTYRSRYAEFLKIDFPRVPITNDTILFKTLAGYGAQLVDLHLLRLPGSGGVGGAGGAAVLSTPGQHGIGQHNVTRAPIDKITYNAEQQRVVIGTGMYFEGVEPDAWDMQIGGYQPLQKWLKDRKGRTLSFDDARHYMRMVLALRETRRLMGEIEREQGIGNVWYN